MADLEKAGSKKLTKMARGEHFCLRLFFKASASSIPLHLIYILHQTSTYIVYIISFIKKDLPVSLTCRILQFRLNRRTDNRRKCLRLFKIPFPLSSPRRRLPMLHQRFTLGQADVDAARRRASGLPGNGPSGGRSRHRSRVRKEECTDGHLKLRELQLGRSEESGIREQ